MTKKLLIFALAMAFGGIANADVIWNWTGADNAYWSISSSWSLTGTSTYTYPTEQYYLSEETPEFVNDDVTHINITGNTVVKDEASRDDLYLGGANCTLTLDASASLTMGDDMKIGRGDVLENSGSNSHVIVQNGSTLVCDDYYTGFSDQADSWSCTTDVLSGSTMQARRVRIGHGGVDTLNIDGAGTHLEAQQEIRLGYTGYNRTSYPKKVTMNVTGGATVEVGTGEDQEGIDIGNSDDSWAELNVTGADATHKSTVTAYGRSTRVAEEDNSLGTLNLTNATYNADYVYVGYSNGSEGTINVNDGGTLNCGSPTPAGSEDLNIARSGGTGVVTINSGGTVWVPDDVNMASNESGSHATLTVNAGGLIDIDSSLKVGSNGTAIVNVYGTVDNASDVNIGTNENGNGTLNIYEGAVMNVGGTLKTNDSNVLNTGTVVMSGGDLNIDEALVVCRSGTVGSEGTFTLSEGTVDVGLDPQVKLIEEVEVEGPDDLILGWYDTDVIATLAIEGGTMTVEGAICMGYADDGFGEAITVTGSNTGQLRLNISGGTLQAEDYIDAGTFADHLITMTGGFLRLNNTAVTEQAMEDLIEVSGDISCPNGYSISTDGDYTVLTCLGITIPGDTNGDNVVDYTDAQTVATNWGDTVTAGDRTSGDFNNDGIVDKKDASIMAANWGDHTGTESGSVPEPSILMLLVGALPFVGLRRKHQ